MPQAIWTGTISFGLVSVPVKLYPATRKQDVRFHELDRVTGRRVRHQRVTQPNALPLPASAVLPEQEQEPAGRPERGGGPATPHEQPAREVSFEELVKGFEVAPRQYVTVSRQELEALAPERSRAIDIEQFVEIAAVDPIYFQTSYYVVPERDHVRSFGLLREAMRTSAMLAICWIVLRRRRHLAALRALDGVMLLTTMLHADEVLPTAELAPPAPADLSRKEREMASLLVSTLSGPFEPARYRDEYRERVKELIERRGVPVESPKAPTGARVQDLMAALKASVEQAKRGRARPARTKTAARQRRRRSA